MDPETLGLAVMDAVPLGVAVCVGLGDGSTVLI
jgi:hypothetical protein